MFETHENTKPWRWVSRWLFELLSLRQSECAYMRATSDNQIEKVKPALGCVEGEARPCFKSLETPENGVGKSVECIGHTAISSKSSTISPLSRGPEFMSHQAVNEHPVCCSHSGIVFG